MQRAKIVQIAREHSAKVETFLVVYRGHLSAVQNDPVSEDAPLERKESTKRVARMGCGNS